MTEIIPTNTSTVAPRPPFQYKKIILFGVVFLMAILPVLIFVSSLKTSESDITRIAHISLIENRISSALQKGVNVPLPSNALELSFGDFLMGYQGRAGKELFLALGIEYLSDPDTGEMYHYFYRPENGEFEVLALLEDNRYANFDVGGVPAYSLGTSKGHMLLINSGKNMGKLVSSVLTSKQKVDLSNPEKRSQIGWQEQKSCLEILQKYPESTSGKYLVQIGGKLQKVYCDMKTSGGGWTLFYANNGHPSSEIQLSYVEMREALKLDTLYDLSEYDNPILAGLLDYHSFIDIGGKEVLIRNRTGDPTKWIKVSFTSSQALSWALGERVLGKLSRGCTDIPGGATWSVVSSDQKIKYENLSSIMNHKGTSWGVSHENYWCNDFIGNVSPHFAFYVSTDSQSGGRTRGVEAIGGAWGGENEFRYFIR